MIKVAILGPFTGYPDGSIESERHFAKGETPDLPDDFAALLIAKGHAARPGPKLPVLPPDPATPLAPPAAANSQENPSS